MSRRHLDASAARDLLAVFTVFLRLGATTFGGMWAATERLERQLVDRAGWLRAEDLRASYVLATLIPAPRFLGLAGLVGFRVRGWRGAFLASLGLILPASLLVLAAAAVVGPGLLDGPLRPLTRAITIAIVGLLFANAYREVRTQNGTRRDRRVGVGLTVMIFLSVVLGVPLIAAGVVGFVAGGLLLRPETAVPEGR